MKYLYLNNFDFNILLTLCLVGKKIFGLHFLRENILNQSLLSLPFISKQVLKGFGQNFNCSLQVGTPNILTNTFPSKFLNNNEMLGHSLGGGVFFFSLQHFIAPTLLLVIHNIIYLLYCICYQSLLVLMNLKCVYAK